MLVRRARPGFVIHSSSFHFLLPSHPLIILVSWGRVYVHLFSSFHSIYYFPPSPYTCLTGVRSVARPYSPPPLPYSMWRVLVDLPPFPEIAAQSLRSLAFWAGATTSGIRTTCRAEAYAKWRIHRPLFVGCLPRLLPPKKMNWPGF